MIKKPEYQDFESYTDYFDAMIVYHRECFAKAQADVKRIDKANAKLASKTRTKFVPQEPLPNSIRARSRETLQDILQDKPALMAAFKQGHLFKL